MIVSGYTLDCYCDKCDNQNWDFDLDNRPLNQFVAEGPKCYSQARKSAKKNGWILKRDGTCICPNCNKKTVK